jgi:hypothetical protein
MEKLQQINIYTYQKFCNSVELFLPVHDIDLCCWAIEADLQFPNPLDFKASKNWVVVLFHPCSIVLF